MPSKSIPGGTWLALACAATVSISASLTAVPASFGATAQHTLTLRIPDEPETLDWNRAHTALESFILLNIMEGLVAYDANLKIVPALAESWKVTDGGKTYTFKLKPGIKWSDGVPLKASDFVYGWQRLLQPLTAASYAYLLFDVVGAKDFHTGKLQDPSLLGIKALDNRTLQVTLVRPVSYWLELLPFWPLFPVRQDLVERYGSSWASPGSLVTLGPYQLIDHDIGRRYTFVSYPGFSGKRGNIDKFFVRIVKSDRDALWLYREGEIDALTGITTIDMKSIIDKKDVRIFPHLKTVYLGFSTTDYPFNLPKVRQAISMAIDRAAIVKKLYGATAASSFVPPPLPGYSRTDGMPYDPRKARQELETSGFIAGDQPFTLLLPNWDEDEEVASSIQSQLKKNLGLNVEIRKVSNVSFNILRDLHASQIFLGTWGADFPDADNFLSVFLSDSGNNRCAWKNASYDSLVAKARESTRPLQQAALRSRAQKMLLQEQAIIVPLYYESAPSLVHSRVHGFEVDPLGSVYLSRVNVDR